MGMLDKLTAADAMAGKREHVQVPTMYVCTWLCVLLLSVHPCFFCSFISFQSKVFVVQNP